MINALVLTGAYMKQHALGKRSSNENLLALNNRFYDEMEDCIVKEHTHNAWFTENSIRKAMDALADSLSRTDIERWLSAYPTLPVNNNAAKTVAVIMAGNIPLVGFHDMISVLMSGHNFIGKPSSKDDRLIRKIAEVISYIEPAFNKHITFTDGQVKNADAIIATGSNNSSRYFEYYFRNIPHIIRKNRNSVAVLGSQVAPNTLIRLGDDIFSYFGLGCRNVTKLYLHEDFDLIKLLQALDTYVPLAQHNKYMNNIEYYRTVYLMNALPFLDNGVILLKEDQRIASPIGVVYFEKYSQLDTVIEQLSFNREAIQCIVSDLEIINDRILPGESQTPKLWDYADNVDTMSFLADIN